MRRSLIRGARSRAWVALPALAAFSLSLVGGAGTPGWTSLAAFAGVVLVVAALLAGRPMPAGRGFWLGAIALVLLAGLMLAGPGPLGRGVVGYQFVLAYVAAYLLGGCAACSSGGLGAIVRYLCVALTAISALALASRLLPWLVPVPEGTFVARLTFPLDYWNALGLVAAAGSVAALGVSADSGSSARWRVTAAGLFPVCIPALYFTFSRAGLGLALLALAFLAVTLPTAAMRNALVATLPVLPVFVACLFADTLSSHDPRAASGELEGLGVALLTAGAMLAAAWIRHSLMRSDSDRRVLRGPALGVARAGVAAAVLAGAVLVVAAAGVATEGIRQEDNRDRLVSIAGETRGQLWRVAFDGFLDAPVLGNGAGSFELQWDARRRIGQSVEYAHNQYLEVLDEQGAVGLILLFAPIGVALVGARRRLKSCAGATAVALIALWLAALTVDYHWYVPAIGMWIWMLLGTLAAGERAVRAGRIQTVAGVVVACAMLVPVASFGLSQFAINRWRASVVANDLPAAERWARRAERAAPYRSGPHQLLARHAIPRLDWDEALREATAAIERDPDNWEPWFLRASLRSYARLDTSADVGQALRRNPLLERDLSIEQREQALARVMSLYLQALPEPRTLR